MFTARVKGTEFLFVSDNVWARYKTDLWTNIVSMWLRTKQQKPAVRLEQNFCYELCPTTRRLQVADDQVLYMYKEILKSEENVVQLNKREREKLSVAG